MSDRLLVIDDEDMVLRAIHRILHDHDVVCCDNAPEALERFARGERFDIVFSDLMMPQMTGMEFYETLRARHPELAARVVFCSGEAVTKRLTDFLRTTPNLLIEKPFEADLLLELVQHRLATMRPPTSDPLEPEPG